MFGISPFFGLQSGLPLKNRFIAEMSFGRERVARDHYAEH
jgi:hypothetical protein